MTDVVGRVASGRAPGVMLNDAGRAQVERLASRLAAVPLTAVVSSPMERAVQTAEPIARPHGLDVEIVEELNEIAYGDWTGLTFADLAHTRGWAEYNTVRSITRPPGGELITEVQSRAVSALTRLAARFREGTIAVVSHADVIRAIVQVALAVPADFILRIDISPASVTAIDITPSSIVVRSVNGDSAHPLT
jgi:probable phosphoglycerate mutase